MVAHTVQGKAIVRDGKFRKCTFSYPYFACVEVAATDEEVRVRDSKNQSGPVLSFTHNEWNAFIKGVKNDQFNL